MQSILEKDDVEEKRKRSVRYVSIFLLLIMVVSSLGYAFFSNPDIESGESEGANADFFEDQGYWAAKFNSDVIHFSNSKEDIKGIEVLMNKSLNDYYQQTIYADDNQALLQELSLSLGKYASIQPGCLGKCEKNIPEKNCSSNFILWNSSIIENKVKQEEKCIIIEGDLKAVDAFLYKLFGLS